MLRREPRSGLRVLVDRLLDEAGLRPNTAMELGTTEALIAAVRAGVGFAWVPRITLARNAELGELGFVEVPAIAMRRTLSVVMLRVARLSRVAELVRQMLPPWRALSRAGVAVEDTLDLGSTSAKIFDETELTVDDYGHFELLARDMSEGESPRGSIALRSERQERQIGKVVRRSRSLPQDWRKSSLGTGTGAIDKLALPDRSKCN